MSNTQDNEINDFLVNETNSIFKQFQTVLKFLNSRVRYYNIEIHLLTHQILHLKKDIYTYYEILDDYKKDLEHQVKVDVITCKVCYEKISDCIFEPCKHMVCCDECSNKIMDNKCPMCRTNIESKLKIYF